MADNLFQEVREPDAPPEVARIYQEIREATGLPFVNLAWRHMAAFPGVLPWVWGIVGGKDLSADHSELGQTALFCVTETHTQADIERLADAIEESLGAV